MKEMKEVLEKIEYWNAKLITPAIIVLIYIIIVEIFFHHFAEEYYLHIQVLSTLVLVVFVIDVFFLWKKSPNWKYFLKKYWLDVVAIFPFTLAVSGLSRLYKLALTTGRLALGQEIMHSGLEARKGISVAARTVRITRFVRIIARSIRVVTKSRFFRHTKAKHHLKKHGIKVKKKKR